MWIFWKKQLLFPSVTNILFRISLGIIVLRLLNLKDISKANFTIKVWNTYLTDIQSNIYHITNLKGVIIGFSLCSNPVSHTADIVTKFSSTSEVFSPINTACYANIKKYQSFSFYFQSFSSTMIHVTITWKRIGIMD